MASLNKHGPEIGRINFLTYVKAYMADGAVLKKVAGQWKLHGKVKAGVTPQAAYLSARANHDAFMAARPALADYRRELHGLAGLGKAYRLHLAVEMMPSDPDGVWSEVCDGWGDNVHASLDEIVHLCELYQRAVAESKEVSHA